MAENTFDRLHGIAHRFRIGELSLHDATLEAGMSESQFHAAAEGLAWTEDRAGEVGDIADGAGRVAHRLWDRWTGLDSD